MMQVPSVPDATTANKSSADERFTPERALEAVRDRPSLQIIRDALFRDTTRFADFHFNTGIEPDAISDRLERFVHAGLMTLEHGSNEQSQRVYALTAAGRSMEPIVIAVTAWGDGWPTPESPPSSNEYLSSAASRLVTAHVGSPSTVSLPLLIEITLLGSFSVRIAGEIVRDLTIGSQRLLVFLALHDRTIARIAMAGTIWPEASEERAGINLRAALSRLDGTRDDAVHSESAGLSLQNTVAVDFRDAKALARRLIRAGATPLEEDLSPDAMAKLSKELLPDWYDDWILAEAEDWQQLRLDALEAQSRTLTATGRSAEAISAARAAVKVDPLRESAQACLIRAHLAEGNQSEAHKVFERYRQLLHDLLGLTPTPLISDLVKGIRTP